MKIYGYKRCSTCRNALKFLEEKGISFEEIEITEQTPEIAELKKMHTELGSLKKLFNTSGLVYKELGLKDTFDSLSEEEAYALLQSNGKLIKRPFLIGEDVAAVGFKPKEWEELCAK